MSSYWRHSIETWLIHVIKWILWKPQSQFLCLRDVCSIYLLVSCDVSILPSVLRELVEEHSQENMLWTLFQKIVLVSSRHCHVIILTSFNRDLIDPRHKMNSVEIGKSVFMSEGCVLDLSFWYLVTSPYCPLFFGNLSRTLAREHILRALPAIGRLVTTCYLTVIFGPFSLI